MLTEIFQYLKNWFDRNCRKIQGTFEIKDNVILFDGAAVTFLEGQFFRITGSLLNDGVYQYTEDLSLRNESFNGAISDMAVPPSVVSVIAEIQDWQIKYGGVDSVAMSPYQSENKADYGYTKMSGKNGGQTTWQDVFGARLGNWRKLG